MILMQCGEGYNGGMHIDLWDYRRSNHRNTFQWIWEDLTEEIMLELGLEE